MRDRSTCWVPPFCPNPACVHHDAATPSWPWSRAGFYSRQASPQRIQRFHCGHCGRHFSRQTFDPTYWLKRPAVLPEVFHALTLCTGFRQLARKLVCSPQTVYHQALRLGRHALLFHALHRPQGELSEPLALDGLQSFEYSQYHPSLYHCLVGQRSHFTYGFTHSELRRSGTMTARQRARRAELERVHGRPDPRASERDVADLLAIVTAGSRHLELWSDRHPSYPVALAALGPLAVEHHTVSSRAARTPRNPLFPVNLFDLLVRHCCANHKRETIAFSKSIASGIARQWVFVTWRNFGKWFSERARDGTPAMRAGVTDHHWSVPQILSERLFPSRIVLPTAWRRHYDGSLPTRRSPRPRLHTLRYAA